MIFPAPWQLPLLAALVAISFLLIGLGRLVSGAVNPAIALFAGWGVAVFVFVFLGTLTPLPLWAAALALVLPGGVGLWLLSKGAGGEREAWLRAGRIVLLAVPITLLVTAMRPTEWDDFSHWIPNAAYLALHDHFPTMAAPNVASSWPAYPYALPLIGYAASLMTGFSERAGIVFNLFLLIASACLIGDIIAARLARTTSEASSKRLGDWSIAAAALAIVLPFNPSFSLSIGFSASADSATACALAAALVVGMQWFAAASQDAGRYRQAFVLGCCMTVLAGLKQSNIALLAIFFGSVAVAVLAEWRVSRRAWISILVALPMPALTVLLWQHYTAIQMPHGEMAMLPFSKWHFAQYGALFASMAKIMFRKSGHYGVMLALVVVAIMSLRRSSKLDAEDRLYTRSVALMFLGYTSFLILAYTISFAVVEVERAASFWRYSTQLGIASLVAVTVLIAPRWRFSEVWRARLGVAAIALLLLMPALAGKRIRYDLDKTHQGYSAAVARDMGHMLPDHAHVAIVEFYDSGNGAVMTYEMYFRQKQDISWPPFEITRVPQASARDYLSGLKANPPAGPFYVWIDNGGPDTRDLFGIALAQGASYLLLLENGSYSLVRSWAFSPDKEHFVPADFR